MAGCQFYAKEEAFIAVAGDCRDGFSNAAESLMALLRWATARVEYQQLYAQLMAAM